MAWAFLFFNLLVILAAAKLRYAGNELANASPVAMSDWLWWAAIFASVAVVVAAVLAGRKKLRTLRRPLAELLVFPAMFVFEWGMLPPEHWRIIHWLVVAGFAGIVAVLFWADREHFSQWGVTGKYFIPAAKRLAIPTLLMVAVPIIAACFVGSDFELNKRLAATLLYPVYALVQLLVFQVFLITRLRRITESRAAIILVSAGMFALLHWPNGMVMAACFGGAVVWTWVYLEKPNVYALALAMGIAAMAFGNALPRDLTQNLRTGPRYVQVASR